MKVDFDENFFLMKVVLMKVVLMIMVFDENGF